MKEGPLFSAGLTKLMIIPRLDNSHHPAPHRASGFMLNRLMKAYKPRIETPSKASTENFSRGGKQD